MRRGDEHRGSAAGSHFPAEAPQTCPIVSRTMKHGNGTTWPLHHRSEEAKGRLLVWDSPLGLLCCVLRTDTEPLQVLGTRRCLINTQRSEGMRRGSMNDAHNLSRRPQLLP